MKTPISFDEVPYFGNEFRGDLIVTKGVIYYFSHTRVSASRLAEQLPGKETAEVVGMIGNIVPFIGVAPWMFQIADKSVKLGKFLKRNFAPSINKPRIRELRLWTGRDTDGQLQARLDAYIADKKAEELGLTKTRYQSQ